MNQKDALSSRASSLKLTTVKNDKPMGFICAPVAGSRMLKAGAVNVWVKNVEGKTLEVRFTGEAGKSATIPVTNKKGVYSAKIKGGLERGTIWYDSIHAVQSDKTEVVIE